MPNLEITKKRLDIKSKQREKKKRTKMKVSGKKVIDLQKIIKNKK